MRVLPCFAASWASRNKPFDPYRFLGIKPTLPRSCPLNRPARDHLHLGTVQFHGREQCAEECQLLARIVELLPGFRVERAARLPWAQTDTGKRDYSPGLGSELPVSVWAISSLQAIRPT